LQLVDVRNAVSEKFGFFVGIAPPAHPPPKQTWFCCSAIIAVGMTANKDQSSVQDNPKQIYHRFLQGRRWRELNENANEKIGVARANSTADGKSFTVLMMRPRLVDVRHCICLSEAASAFVLE
jgi:hypothetical protein